MEGETGKFHKDNFKCVIFLGMDNFIIRSMEDFIEECLTWTILNTRKYYKIFQGKKGGL